MINYEQAIYMFISVKNEMNFPKTEPEEEQYREIGSLSQRTFRH